MSKLHLRRRQVLGGLGATGVAAAFSLLPGGVRAASDGPVLTDDGIYSEPWFLQSFLDLAEDLETAAENGRNFAIMWELKGCPYCEETHFVNFARADIRDFIRSRFDILQLNFIGSRIVTDFDGEELTERQLAAKYAVRFTPTFQFFPRSTDGLAAKKPRKREIARLPGYVKPDPFLAMFRYIDEGAYKTMSYRAYLRARRGG